MLNGGSTQFRHQRRAILCPSDDTSLHFRRHGVLTRSGLSVELVKFTNGDVARLQDGVHNENMFRLTQGIGVRVGDIITEHPIAGELVGNPQIEDRRGE